jgi:hypothetical protein
VGNGNVKEAELEVAGKVFSLAPGSGTIVVRLSPLGGLLPSFYPHPHFPLAIVSLTSSSLVCEEE